MLTKLTSQIYSKLQSLYFIYSGMKPWTRGYGFYKIQSIKRALYDDVFNPLDLVKGYGFRLDERIVEYPWFFSRLPTSEGNLLDAGSVLNFEYILSNPSIKSKKLFISTLAPESQCYWTNGISYVFEDLRYSCFKDGYFDWVASLSTIEHIGLDNTMLYTDDSSKNENHSDTYLQAIKEYHRVLNVGGVLYLSFPYGKHINRKWFQVFDGQMIDGIIETFKPTRHQAFYFKYEPDGWKASTREEAKDATYFDIHTQPTYDADYAAASRAIVCLELVK
jgi:hypothetical protein